MHKVKIQDKILYAEDGTLLSDILMEAAEGVEHPCGGRGICKKCTVTVNGREELSCQYRICSDIIVALDKKGEIVSETGVTETENAGGKMCFVLDIGTTTLALALVGIDNGEIIKVITRTNPQIVFGADVMSRIDYCRKNGAEPLKKAVISGINSMISALDIKEIETLYVSGNTTMLHLFFGVDCSSIGVAPYSPVFLEARTEKGESLGITGVKTVCSLPSISSFVGADIVAGLNFVGKPEAEKHNLLIDLGTNAEIVLFDEKTALCTAAAAGPCFEGANISCGMSATDGAVYSYYAKSIKTVGNVPAKGICGTGLIDVIAELISDGIIDETGYMEQEESEIADGVSISQGDIRQYQLAKSAVFSAVVTLMKKKKVSFEDIDKMYISGGFSAKINIENAIKTGLLPKELAEKCVTVNNSSLLGTVKYIYEKNDLTPLTENAAYVDLSSDAVFSELFIENMMF